MSATWESEYRTEHGRLLAGRLLWCTALAFLGAGILGGQAALFGGYGADAQVRFAVLYGGVSAGVWVIGRFVVRRDRGTALALAYVLLLIILITAQYIALARDAELAAAGFLATMMGVMVLLPWGATPQAVVSLACLLGYACVMCVIPGALKAGGAVLLVSMLPVSIAAAELIERYRARAFERTWQQDRMISLARTLSADLDPAAIAPTVLEHGMSMLAADSASLSLYDNRRHLYEVKAFAGADPVSESSWLGVELPDDYPPLGTIVAHGCLVLPDDDPDNPIVHSIRSYGCVRVLYVALRYGEDPQGILGFVRRSPERFTDADRRLARGIGDQAARAIRTARLIEDLRQADSLKTEFLATMSHELRTPLNVMLGFAEMARDPVIEPGEREDCLERIEIAGRDLLGLIEKTLEIRRIEAGKDTPRLERIDLGLFWTELRDSCSRMPHAADVRLNWRAVIKAASVVTDPRKLTVIVRNLVGNALKFTTHGAVTVEADVEPGTLVVRVSDTGIGIRREEQTAIFEMFRQAEQANTQQYSGTGLGLYIVKRFVEQLGGSVSVESELGAGSCFTARFPVGTALSEQQNIPTEGDDGRAMPGLHAPVEAQARKVVLPRVPGTVNPRSCGLSRARTQRRTSGGSA
jgi:signal transduction histidine kinase